jgi:hypothetical protein
MSIRMEGKSNRLTATRLEGRIWLDCRPVKNIWAPPVDWHDYALARQ